MKRVRSYLLLVRVEELEGQRKRVEKKVKGEEVWVEVEKAKGEKRVGERLLRREEWVEEACSMMQSRKVKLRRCLKKLRKVLEKRRKKLLNGKGGENQL